MNALDNGSVVPSLEERAQFAYDLRQAIVSQILDGCDIIRADMFNMIYLCKLPHANQLLDFTSLTHADDAGSFNVKVSIPSTKTSAVCTKLTFVYDPPDYEV